MSQSVTVSATGPGVRSLEQTPVPTGHLSVPELEPHTIGDNLVLITMENYYAREGESGLLQQAYTNAIGHCTTSLNLGPARFAENYRPGSVTGAVGPNDSPPSRW